MLVEFLLLNTCCVFFMANAFSYERHCSISMVQHSAMVSSPSPLHQAPVPLPRISPPPNLSIVVVVVFSFVESNNKMLFPVFFHCFLSVVDLVVVSV